MSGEYNTHLCLKSRSQLLIKNEHNCCFQIVFTVITAKFNQRQILRIHQKELSNKPGQSDGAEGGLFSFFFSVRVRHRRRLCSQEPRWL